MKRIYAPKTNTSSKYVRSEEKYKGIKKFLIPITEIHANRKKPFSMTKQANAKILKISAVRLGIRKHEALFFRV